jgi:hypothetical protein
VERGVNNSRVPLAPGVALGSLDKVVTGDNGRLLLRLADGSTVKLGEKARLNLTQAEATRDNDVTTLQATLNVLVGAFRFTTNAFDKLQNRRTVDIKISTVTAGIRGTDLWGAQRPDREIVCLIEGNITVDRELGSTIESVVLDQRPACQPGGHGQRRPTKAVVARDRNGPGPARAAPGGRVHAGLVGIEQHHGCVQSPRRAAQSGLPRQHLARTGKGQARV